MIKYSDRTLNECAGQFQCTAEKMGIEQWMLKSRVTAIADGMGFNYTIHFWNNGRVYIMQSDRPLGIEVPEDDLRLLSKWCTDCGWTGLFVADRLLADPQERSFWERMFRSGIVDSDILRKKDDEEMMRMAQLMEEERRGDD